MRNISKIILLMLLLTSAGLSSAANQARVPVTGETGGATGSANGTAWPNGRFVVGSGTSANCVSDKLTGLMWVKDLNTVIIKGSTINGSYTNWQNALESVKQANIAGGYCGYTDWRLPNISELKSLANYGQSSPAGWLNTQEFANVRTGLYWSSSTNASGTTTAWGVNFGIGFVNAFSRGASGYVWPVRLGR